VGAYSQSSSTTGSGNTSLGNLTLIAATTGSCNTAVGACAGCNITTGTNNTFLGYRAVAATITDSNTITLGNSAITTIRAQVTSITALSDCRDKTNIVGIPVGLNFIREVRPVKFTWNMRDRAQVGVDDAGFIAQELDALSTCWGVEWLNLVKKDNPNRFEATPNRLFPVVIQAIKDLADRLDQQSQHPLKVAKFTTETRDQLEVQDGMLIYNVNESKFQGYANGAWINLG
jgi:hypothetical protein